jgi:antitoxin component of RelBE/YafQ-DinJ toxin-antitoxin module
MYTVFDEMKLEQVYGDPFEQKKASIRTKKLPFEQKSFHSNKKASIRTKKLPFEQKSFHSNKKASIRPKKFHSNKKASIRTKKIPFEQNKLGQTRHKILGGNFLCPEKKQMLSNLKSRRVATHLRIVRLWGSFIVGSNPARM